MKKIYAVAFAYLISGCSTDSSTLEKNGNVVKALGVNIENEIKVADNDKLKIKTTTDLEARDNIYYIPDSTEPFTGIYQEFHVNGNKKREVNFKNGKENGLVTLWHENGQQEAEVNFIDGKSEGVSTRWYKNGETNGLASTWYENGQKKTEESFKNGKLNGTAFVWNENGQKQAEMNYKDGVQNGLATIWDEKGQKKKEAEFKNGKELVVKKSNAKDLKHERSSLETMAIAKTAADQITNNLFYKYYQEQCQPLEMTATVAMTNRQAGASIEHTIKTISKINSGQDIDNIGNIIATAYARPKLSTEKMRKKSIEVFRNEVSSACAEQVKLSISEAMRNLK